ncbi:MAG: endonuclease/exonuclease/phosphatase family protein [Solirubrobacterales bacterium]
MDRPLAVPGRLALVAALLASITCLAVWQSADRALANHVRETRVSVMTRNIYLGADLVPAFVASDREEFERRAGDIFRTVRKPDFPSRAKRLAREVRAATPDVIGLQEVALWRRGEDGEKDGDDTPAQIVEYDFLRTLRTELRRQGLNYRTSVSQVEADIEVPTDLGYDVRLSMRDVILTRRGAGIVPTRSRRDRYQDNLTVSTPVGTFTSRRGWVSLDATVRGQPMRFVNTHLESVGAEVRADQARELRASGGPLRTSRPLVVLGDLNSSPIDDSDEGAAYRVLESFGMRDAVQEARGNPIRTCCLSETVDDARFDYDTPIDHVLVRGSGLRGRTASRVGDDPGNRTSDGLWPSDHAGIFARLRVRRAAPVVRRAPAFTGRAGR